MRKKEIKRVGNNSYNNTLESIYTYAQAQYNIKCPLSCLLKSIIMRSIMGSRSEAEYNSLPC